MEKMPTQKNSERNMVRKPVSKDGKIIGYEHGETYTEFPLKKLEERSHYQCEFETESGNKYILKMVKPEDTDENPELFNQETPFMMVNTKTGETSPVTKQDIESGVIKVG